MKPTHVAILLLVVLGVLYVISLGIGARLHDDEGPKSEKEQRNFDISESYPSIGSVGRWFSPKVELPQSSYTLEEGERAELQLPASDDRYRRLELEVTEPTSPGKNTLTITYTPETAGGEDYPDDLTDPAPWPETDEDLPRCSFLILNGGGTITIVNNRAERLRIEVR